MRRAQTFGRAITVEDVELLAFEHVLCDSSAVGCEWVPNRDSGTPPQDAAFPVTLESLGLLRLEPTIRTSNMVLDSTEIATRELAALASNGKRCAVVCDVTTVDEGRNIHGLERIASALRGVKIAYGASISRHGNKKSADEVSHALRRELQVGPSRAAFITLRFEPQDDELLAGALSASNATGALIVVTLPTAKSLRDLEESARSAVERLGPRVLLRSPSRVDPTLLTRFALCVVDGFGRPFERTFAPDYDVDDPERIRLLADNKDLRSRVLASVGIRYKTQLLSYGGLGYGCVFGDILRKKHLQVRSTTCAQGRLRRRLKECNCPRPTRVLYPARARTRTRHNFAMFILWQDI